MLGNSIIGNSISKNSVILGVFAAVTAGLIALTFQGTETRILAAERAAQQKALYEIVPRERHDNDLLNDLIHLEGPDALALGIQGQAAVHVARVRGDPVAFIFPAVAPDGYSGDIRMIVGINIDGTVAGVRVLSHKETPGLGDLIELAKSDWMLGFAHKSLGQPPVEQWAVKKDGGVFDAFTGATITPRAVVGEVRDVLTFFAEHKSRLTEAAAPSGEPEHTSESRADDRAYSEDPAFGTRSQRDPP